MLIFALDDEPLQLEVLTEAILAAEPAAEVRAFGYADAAIRAMREETLRPEIVFSDIEMPGMTGMEFAQRLHEACPRTNLIFVTGFRQYAAEAYALRPSGYVLKPVNAQKIRTELDNLRFPSGKRGAQRLRVQCFGGFEAFADGKPLVFRYRKSKELLAYLVDRNGASADTAELCAVLWEDRADTKTLRNQLRNLVADLRRTLREAGAADVLRTARNRFSVDAERLDCDYYRFLAGDPTAAFVGEYMQKYSWAEARLAALEARNRSHGGTDARNGAADARNGAADAAGEGEP